MSIFGRRMLDAADRLALPPPPPESENGAADMYATEEASFDTNMVIILAALLCTLIFALGLNSIVRCAIRFRRRLRSDGAGRGCRRPAGSGLKKNALRKIPVVVYGSDGAGIRPATECPICLGEFEDGDWREGPGPTRVQPRVPCEVHRHMVGVSPVVPDLSALLG